MNQNTKDPNVIEGEMRLMIREINGSSLRCRLNWYRLEVFNGCFLVTAEHWCRSFRPETVITIG
jgi:hypothetical protein